MNTTIAIKSWSTERPGAFGLSPSLTVVVFRWSKTGMEADTMNWNLRSGPHRARFAYRFARKSVEYFAHCLVSRWLLKKWGIVKQRNGWIYIFQYFQPINIQVCPHVHALNRRNKEGICHSHEEGKEVGIDGFSTEARNYAVYRSIPIPEKKCLVFKANHLRGSHPKQIREKKFPVIGITRTGDIRESTKKNLN